MGKDADEQLLKKRVESASIGHTLGWAMFATYAVVMLLFVNGESYRWHPAQLLGLVPGALLTFCPLVWGRGVWRLGAREAREVFGYVASEMWRGTFGKVFGVLRDAKEERQRLAPLAQEKLAPKREAGQLSEPEEAAQAGRLSEVFDDRGLFGHDTVTGMPRDTELFLVESIGDPAFRRVWAAARGKDGLARLDEAAAQIRKTLRNP